MAFDLLPHEVRVDSSPCLRSTFALLRLSKGPIILQMLSKILRVLPPSERLDSALTCRTFADTLTDSPLLDDIWLVINGLQVEKIVPAIIASRRQYRNIRIIGGMYCTAKRPRGSLGRLFSTLGLRVPADLSGDTMSIFTDLGEHVRKLAIIECKFKSDVFYSILRLCPKLQSLELIGERESFPSLP